MKLRKVSAGIVMKSPGDSVRTRFAAIPIGIGAAMIAVGLWMYAFPNPFCTSSGPISSCPVPPSYYEVPNTILVVGAVVIALGPIILVPSILRRRRVAAQKVS